MAIRMTGLISGLDTEGIIKELMQAQNTKKNKVQSKITKLEWKQEKWKELNTKIYKLYTDSVSKMRFESTYLAKKAQSTNESKLSVSAGTDAVEGTHTVTVDRLASSQYLTSGKLGSDVTNTTKLSDLGFDTSKVIRVQAGNDDAVDIEVGENTTVAEFVNSLKNAGVNANFDSSNKRIFISSKISGIDGAFSITTGELTSGTEKTALKEALGYSDLSSSDQTKADKLIANLRTAAASGDADAVTEAEEALVTFAKDSVKASITAKATEEAEAAYKAGLAEGEEVDEDAMKAAVDEAVSAALEAASEDLETLEADVLSRSEAFVSAVEEGDFEATGSSALGALGLTDVSYSVDEDGAISYTYDESSSANLVKAEDATITYNGATFTSGSSTFTVNGLTFTATGVTDPGEKITVTVSKDVDAVYDQVKDFVSKYNELLKEMNTLYNAASARDYDVLTDEQKEEMTDDEIEKWETKIKDSLLRRDDNLGNLISAMRTSLSGSVSVDGVNHSMLEFGITTGSDYSENGLLHIHGDADDTYGANYSDKLKAALSSDPETVMKTLSGAFKNLYSTMQDKMKASNVSSALTFYNDKEMNKTMTSYKDELSTLEERLQEIEDRYYKQFSAMETAMANLQSQQNNLAAMLGTSTG